MSQMKKSAKSMAMETMMRSPKMKRALEDAFKAPVGSTKRAKAKAMLSSIYKLTSKQLDGQGGPGIPYRSNPGVPFKDLKNPWAMFRMPQANVYPNAFAPMSAFEGQEDGKGGPFGFNVPQPAPSYGPAAPSALSGVSAAGTSTATKTTPQVGSSTKLLNQAPPSGWIPSAAGAVWSGLKSIPGQIGENFLSGAAEAEAAAKYGTTAWQAAKGMEQSLRDVDQSAKNALMNKAWYGSDVLPVNSPTPWTQTPSGQQAAKTLATPTWGEEYLVSKYPWLAGSQAKAVSKTAPTAPNVPSVSSPAVGVTHAGNIPFKEGLSEEQKKGIQNLVNRKLDPNTWTAQDKANWKVATNNAPLPSVETAPKGKDNLAPVSNLTNLKGLGFSLGKTGATPATQVPPPADTSQPSGQNISISSKTSSSTSESGTSGPSDVSTPPASTPPAAGITDPTAGLSGWAKAKALMEQGYKQGLGPEAAAAQAMQILNDPANIQQLRDLLPGTPDWALPKGASLSGQIDELKKLKYKEMGLEALEKKQKEMLANGANVQQDLADYVKGKDEYLNHIDTLIQQHEAKSLNDANFANPEVQAENARYSQYLTTLKGKQYQRYADVLNESINQYNTDYNNVVNEYNTTLAKYNDEMASDAAITTEAYTRLSQALTGLYTNMVNVSNASAAAAEKELQNQKTQLEMIKLANEVASGGTTKEGDYMKGITLVKSPAYTDSTTGYLLPGTSIPAILSDIGNNNYDDNAKVAAVQTLMAMINAEFDSPSDKYTGSKMDQMNRINGILSSYTQDPTYKAIAENPEAAAKAAATDPRVATAMKMNAAITSNLARIMEKEKILLQEELAPDASKIRQAIQLLLGTSGTWGFGAKEPLNLAEAQSEMSKLGLSKDVIDIISSAWSSGDIKTRKDQYLKFNDEDLAKEIANFGIEGMAMNKFSGFLQS